MNCNPPDLHLMSYYRHEPPVPGCTEEFKKIGFDLLNVPP
jgi:hypothetical protein